MSLDRVLLVKAHMALAAFILPVAMLFVITGALYTWGIKGGYETQTILLPLRESMQNNKTWLSALAVQELNRRSLKVSSGGRKNKAGRELLLF